MVEKITRDRIVEAAAALLTEGGREAVSTRAVGAAAGLQAPTHLPDLRRQAGPAGRGRRVRFATHLVSKTASPPPDDPVQDLRRGWDLPVEFGLSHPAFHTLIYGEPRPGHESPAAREAALVLAAHVHRIAEAGRFAGQRGPRRAPDSRRRLRRHLRADRDPPDRRDLELSAIARESIIATVTTGEPRTEPGNTLISTVVALCAALSGATALTTRDRALLSEWLDRITHQ